MLENINQNISKQLILHINKTLVFSHLEIARCCHINNYTFSGCSSLELWVCSNHRFGLSTASLVCIAHRPMGSFI